jgi:hypothetical protein
LQGVTQLFDRHEASSSKALAHEESLSADDAQLVRHCESVQLHAA